MKKIRSKFAVVLPTYNRADRIVKAIESVIQQSFQDWQLLIIDDGSTDNTREVVAPLLEDQRILFFQIHHGGAGKARNRGLQEANAEWICFLDSDDYYLPNHLSVLHDFVEESHNIPAFIYTGSSVQRKGALIELPIVESGKDLISHVIYEFLMINSICLPKAAFEENHFPEFCTTWQDLHLWYRMISLYPFHQIPIYTTVVVDHDGRNHIRILNNRTISAISNRINCMNDLFDNYNSILSDEVATRKAEIIIHEYTRWCNRFIKSRKEISALKVLYDSFKVFFLYGQLIKWGTLLMKTIIYMIFRPR